MTSDCVNGCFNGSDTTPEYYCENPNKVGYCCPKASTDFECTPNTTASIYCSKSAKTINAKYLFCVTFESACSTATNYINGTADNTTVASDRMSDRGFSCWWEISLDRTLWNQAASYINVYITTVNNVTAYVGSGLGRENVTTFTSTIVAKSYKVNATSNVYIAAIPTKSKLYSNFSFTYNIEGSYIQEDLSYEIAFWKKAIGIIVGFVLALAFGLGGWLYYQKYGCS